MSHLAEQLDLELDRNPTKLRLLTIIARLLIDQIRLLEENSSNRQKALSQWQPTNSSKTDAA